MDRTRVFEDWIACPCCHSRPPSASGNELNKPLDSGLHRNDEVLVVTSAIISTCLRRAGIMIKTKVTGMRLSLRRHSSESWNPGRQRRDARSSPALGRTRVFEDGMACRCCHSRLPSANGNGLNKPLDSGLRRNDEVLVVTSAVIPAKAGISEGGAGLVNSCPALVCSHKR